MHGDDSSPASEPEDGEEPMAALRGISAAVPSRVAPWKYLRGGAIID